MRQRCFCASKFHCGVNIVIRSLHTFLVLAVPTTLLCKNTVLRSCLIELQDPLYGLVYLTLLLLSLFMYYMACLVDPGYLPKQTHEKATLSTNTDDDSDNDDDDHIPMLKHDNSTLNRDQMYRYCDVCEIEQPLRAKHCEDCKRCVRKYDHHCPWLETCVGECNHKYFWLFLCSTSVLIIWTSVITWRSFQHEKDWSDWFKENVFFYWTWLC